MTFDVGSPVMHDTLGLCYILAFTRLGVLVSVEGKGRHLVPLRGLSLADDTALREKMEELGDAVRVGINAEGPTYNTDRAEAFKALRALMHYATANEAPPTNATTTQPEE